MSSGGEEGEGGGGESKSVVVGGGPDNDLGSGSIATEVGVDVHQKVRRPSPSVILDPVQWRKRGEEFGRDQW